jgi:hypothetical protein
MYSGFAFTLKSRSAIAQLLSDKMTNFNCQNRFGKRFAVIYKIKIKEGEKL